MVTCKGGIRIKSSRKKIPPKKIPLKAVERKPAPTTILNPSVSEASYKPKQRSYRKMNLIFFFAGGFYPGTHHFLPLHPLFDIPHSNPRIEYHLQEASDRRPIIAPGYTQVGVFSSKLIFISSNVYIFNKKPCKVLIYFFLHNNFKNHDEITVLNIID